MEWLLAVSSSSLSTSCAGCDRRPPITGPHHSVLSVVFQQRSGWELPAVRLALICSCSALFTFCDLSRIPRAGLICTGCRDVGGGCGETARPARQHITEGSASRWGKLHSWSGPGWSDKSDRVTYIYHHENHCNARANIYLECKKMVFYVRQRRIKTFIGRRQR